MNLLLVDDDHTVRRSLHQTLSGHGFTVKSAEDGESAFHILSQEDGPGLLVLDWMMPKLTGPEVCRKIRASKVHKNSYIIMLTVKGEKTDVVRGLEAGANDYLVKPFHVEELLARLEVGKRMLSVQENLIEEGRKLQQARKHIKTLQGFLSRCSWCSRIRSETGDWEDIETYMLRYADVNITHGICPECLTEQMPSREHTHS